MKNVLHWLGPLMGLALFTLSGQTAAMNLDTLFLAGNDNGNGIFTATNGTDSPEYIQTTVVKVDVRGGKLIKTPLTRDNFPLWDLAVNPAKTMLQPGEVRNFAVKSLCQRNCDREVDALYQIRFTPVANPEQEKGQSVNIRFGMAPYYVIPATKQRVEYDVMTSEDKQQVTVDNTGNTFIKLEFNACHSLAKNKKNCRAVYHVLAGRSKTIALPAEMAGRNVQVTVANYDQSIQKEFTL